MCSFIIGSVVSLLFGFLECIYFNFRHSFLIFTFSRELQVRYSFAEEAHCKFCYCSRTFVSLLKYIANILTYSEEAQNCVVSKMADLPLTPPLSPALSMELNDNIEDDFEFANDMGKEGPESPDLSMTSSSDSFDSDIDEVLAESTDMLLGGKVLTKLDFFFASNSSDGKRNSIEGENSMTYDPT